MYKFRSADGKQEIKYTISPGADKTVLTNENGSTVSVLELDSSLLPVKYINNNVTKFSTDYGNYKINFADVSYDIQEPVFTPEHLLALYSCVDWTKIQETSLLFLRNNRMRCAVSSAKCEKISEDEIKISCDNYINTVELFIKKGIPVKYVVDNTDTFDLVPGN